MACCAFLAGSTQNASAQCAAGETEVTITITPGSFPLEIVWELVDDVTSTVVASRACGTSGGSVQDICLNDGQTYTFNAFDDWGDGWNGGTFNIKIKSNDCVLASGAPNNGVAGDGTDNCVGFDLEQSVTFQTDAPIAGCTNPAASNFNVCATIDNGSCILPAPNNACADAIDIPAGSCYVGSNVGATAGDGAVSPTCVDGAANPADIWFTTTIGASGAVQVVFTDNPGFSSIAELYLGTCDSLGAGILASLGACSNYADNGGFTLSGLPAGATLYIRWWDFGSNDFGGMELCINEPVPGCTNACASNFNALATIDDGSCAFATDADDCASAASVSEGTTFYVSAGATGTDISSCTSNDSLDVWFAYSVPSGLDSVLIYTCSSTFDTGLSLWDACGGNELGCNDDGTPGGGSNCGGSSFQSYLLLTGAGLDTIAGSTIYIRIAGFNGSSGCGDLIIDERGAAPPIVCSEPVNLNAMVSAAGVTLSWDAVADAIGYRITGGPVGGPYVNRVSNTNSKFIPKGQLNPSTCYEYAVRAKCVDNSTSPLSVTDGFCTPAARIGELAEVQLFPNPADEMTILSFQAETEEALAVQIYDLSGKLMMTESLVSVSGMNNLTLNTSKLVNGSYLVQLLGDVTSISLMVDVKH